MVGEWINERAALLLAQQQQSPLRTSASSSSIVSTSPGRSSEHSDRSSPALSSRPSSAASDVAAGPALHTPPLQPHRPPLPQHRSYGSTAPPAQADDEEDDSLPLRGEGEEKSSLLQRIGQSQTAGAARRVNGLTQRLDRFFLISDRGSSITQECRAGAVTFVTMAYIVVVNAAILSKSGPDPSDGSLLAFDSVVLATSLSAAFGSAFVGLFANLPFGLAPGMGLNSYFTYGVCLKMATSGVGWRVALTCCFVQGLLFMLLSLAGACELMQRVAPVCIKKGITIGLGLFQALIGFELMRLVVSGKEVLLGLGAIWSDPRIAVSLGGMMLICALHIWRIKGAMLVGMVVITLAAWGLDPASAPDGIVAWPSLSSAHWFAMLDFAGWWAHLHSSVIVTLMMLFVAVFDTAGVQYMCGAGANLMDEHDQLPGAKAAFFGAGAATSLGACLGTGPVIIHNETFAGITDGARTGLSSLVVAALFCVCIPFVPILRAVPPIATAAPLVIVGMHMMFAASHVHWDRTEDAMPAFLCASLLPLTYSIATGMVAGIAAFALLRGAKSLGMWIAPERFRPAEESTEPEAIVPEEEDDDPEDKPAARSKRAAAQRRASAAVVEGLSPHSSLSSHSPSPHSAPHRSLLRPIEREGDALRRPVELP